MWTEKYWLEKIVVFEFNNKLSTFLALVIDRRIIESAQNDIVPFLQYGNQ